MADGPAERDIVLSFVTIGPSGLQHISQLALSKRQGLKHLRYVGCDIELSHIVVFKRVACFVVINASMWHPIKTYDMIIPMRRMRYDIKWLLIHPLGP